MTVLGQVLVGKVLVLQDGQVQVQGGQHYQVVAGNLAVLYGQATQVPMLGSPAAVLVGKLQV